jgi:SOS-response transcriptional repressor LexA
MTSTVRPTKKQRQLLSFIEQFIGEHGYSPSYREIMTGLNYTSVATVALHINNLIKRGHLRKRDHSARSLEVTTPVDDAKVTSNDVKPGEERWLVDKVEHFFAEAESLGEVTQELVDQLFILTGALRVLGLEGAAQSFVPRLSELKKRAPQ